MAGGGTGGHLFPAIAIAEAFLEKNADNDILFVSTGNIFEKNVLARQGLNLECIPAEGMKGMGIWRQIKALVKIPKGIHISLKIIEKFNPDMVFGVGSYASCPIILAARIRNIPVVIHEQNILPGITNRVIAPMAKRVYVSFPETRFRIHPSKVRFTGNPVRKQILAIAETFPQRESLAESPRILDGYALSSPDRPFTVGIIGGSQGAHAINLAVVQALPFLRDRSSYHFIHQTGPADVQMVQDAYQRYGISNTVQPFFDDMSDCYMKSHLVICRSGATTVAEITAIGIPAIFIPFPYAADNHQALNACSLVQANAAEMVLESRLTGELLAERIQQLSSNLTTLHRMADCAHRLGNPLAARSIVEDCYALLGHRDLTDEISIS